MGNTPFILMQQAVDIVAASPHPSNKIAAAIAGKDAEQRTYTLARYNYWPEVIIEKIGMETRIGNSSGTVHAETACLLHAPMTDGAALFVTDPPCPNCVKNMTEAGIKTLYIDHKGFDKDFAARRGEDFRNLSLDICRKAGIAVFKVFRKEQRLESVLEIPAGYTPAIEKPARLERLKARPDAELFAQLIKAEKDFYKDRPFAATIAHGPLGAASMISAEIHAIAGFTSKSAEPEGKYNHLLQPVHRVLMTAARYGFKIDRNFIFSSRVPTARELVNLVGADFFTLHIGDRNSARDEHSLQALKQLNDAGVVEIKTL